MRGLRSIGLLSVIAASNACDPLAGVSVRRSLVPAPAQDCVRTALAGSPLAASVVPPSDLPLDDVPAARSNPPPAVYLLQVRDSIARGGLREARLTVGSDSAQSATLAVDFMQPGMTFTLGRDEARHLATIGSQLTSMVRAACAPGSPDDETCRIQGFGPTRRCHAEQAG